MHVDGFRFDLAATLARGAHTVDTWSAFFATIHQDPVLQGVKLIAEPWDTGTNGYQVGNFPFHWSEWNDRYRESVRRFWRERAGPGCRDVAARLTGSIDLFKGSGRRAVRQHQLHRQPRRSDAGRPGGTASAGGAGAGERDTRRRLQRNLLATVLLSMGTPMIDAGDEWGRTQQGHDNAYNQDNAISWLDWSAADESLRAFVQQLIRIRKEIPWLQHGQWPGRDLQVRWLRPDAQPLDEGDWQARRGPTSRCSAPWMDTRHCCCSTRARTLFATPCPVRRSRHGSCRSGPTPRVARPRPTRRQTRSRCPVARSFCWFAATVRVRREAGRARVSRRRPVRLERPR